MVWKLRLMCIILYFRSIASETGPFLMTMQKQTMHQSITSIIINLKRTMHWWSAQLCSSKFDQESIFPWTKCKTKQFQHERLQRQTRVWLRQREAFGPRCHLHWSFETVNRSDWSCSKEDRQKIAEPALQCYSDQVQEKIPVLISA